MVSSRSRGCKSCRGLACYTRAHPTADEREERTHLFPTAAKATPARTRNSAPETSNTIVLRSQKVDTTLTGDLESKLCSRQREQPCAERLETWYGTGSLFPPACNRRRSGTGLATGSRPQICCVNRGREGSFVGTGISPRFLFRFTLSIKGRNCSLCLVYIFLVECGVSRKWKACARQQRCFIVEFRRRVESSVLDSRVQRCVST